jgi:hypothetical protein
MSESQVTIKNERHVRRLPIIAAAVTVAPSAGFLLNSAISGAATGSQGSSPDPFGKPNSSSAPVQTQGELSVATLAQTLGEQQYADAFAGAELLADGRVLIHTIPGRDAAFRAALQRVLSAVSQSPGGPSYAYVPAANSWSELDALTQQIAADATNWQARGINLAEFGPDPASNRVLIQLTQYTPLAAQQLTDNYGSSLIAISTTSDQATLLPATDRYTDISPYYAGDAVWGSGQPIPNCTDNFAVSDSSGHFYQLIAGHCTDFVGQYYYTNIPNPAQLGTVAQIHLRDSTQYDAALIGGVNSVGRVWTTGTTSISVAASAKSPAVGDKVTVNGQRSGEVRDTTVQAVDKCIQVNYPPVTWVCHMDKTIKSGFVITQPGDSGGPVYQYVSGKNYVLPDGLIVATESNDNSVCYFHFLSGLLNLFSVTLLPPS